MAPLNSYDETVSNIFTLFTHTNKLKWCKSNSKTNVNKQHPYGICVLYTTIHINRSFFFSSLQCTQVGFFIIRYVYVLSFAFIYCNHSYGKTHICHLPFATYIWFTQHSTTRLNQSYNGQAISQPMCKPNRCKPNGMFALHI